MMDNNKLQDKIIPKPTTPEQFVQRYFFDIDTNHDYYLSRGEYLDRFSDGFLDKKFITEDDAIKMFEEALAVQDLNKDGYISYGELFRNLCSDQDIVKDNVKKIMDEKYVNELFDMYDLNQDGTITKEEIQQADQQRQPQPDLEKTNDDAKENSLSPVVITVLFVAAVITLVGMVTLIVYYCNRKKKIDTNTQHNLDDVSQKTQKNISVQ